MANSILDALFGRSIAPQVPGVPPMPAPNPLRGPAPTPQVGGVGSLLSSIFQLPDMAGLLPGGENSEAVKKVQGANRDAEARQYYNAEGVQMPLPQRGARANPQATGEAEAEAGDDDSDAGDDSDNETPPIPTRAPGESAMATSQMRGPDGGIRVPVRQTGPVADPLKAMMLQMGLGLMTPSWGNTMSQIGQAVGGGVAAAGRAQQINENDEKTAKKEATSEEDRALKNRNLEANLEQTEEETRQLKSGESSRAKRLGKKQPTVLDEAAAAANLGPKGKAYLAQRLKTLNTDDLLGDETDPVEKFNKIIGEAQKLDAPAAPAKVPNVGGVDTATNLPIIKTPEEAKKLKSGTKFLFEQNGKMIEGTAP